MYGRHPGLHQHHAHLGQAVFFPGGRRRHAVVEVKHRLPEREHPTECLGLSGRAREPTDRIGYHEASGKEAAVRLIMTEAVLSHVRPAATTPGHPGLPSPALASATLSVRGLSQTTDRNLCSVTLSVSWPQQHAAHGRVGSGPGWESKQIFPTTRGVCVGRCWFG